MIRPRWHGPTIRGRLRSDAGLLVLIGLVVAVTTLLVAAATPLGDRAADRAVSAAVRDAGLDAVVVATLPQEGGGPVGTARDPQLAEELRQVASDAQLELPPKLSAVLHPGVTTVATPALHLLEAGPARYLDLTYVDTPAGSPAVTYVAGGPPGPGVDDASAALAPDAPPHPVQVAVSRAVARALGVGPGDRLGTEDDRHRPVRVRISGVYVPTQPRSVAWQVAPDLLAATRAVSEGLERITGGALVSPESLPDLPLAVPADDLAHHIVFVPRPELVRWRDTGTVIQEVAHLQASADLAGSGISWDSSLGRVLSDARGRISAAQGQAEVILVGLVLAALLVLALAAQLLVARRAGPLTMARERGASLITLAAELFAESLLVASIGTALGLAAARLVAGGVGWAWTVPVLLVAALAAPLRGGVFAARATSVRRVPANRSARRALERARRAERLAVEAVALVAAVLSYVALRQRGIVQQSGWGNLTAAAAAVAGAVVGTLVCARLLAPALRLGLRAARRSTADAALLVLARLGQTAARLLPLLAVSVAVAQLTFGIALAATEQHGQDAGALLAVGGDARLTTAAPDPALVAEARRVAGAPGVRAAVAARVADDVQLVSRHGAAPVRLVVVDATAYRRLLELSGLPDAPQLARLSAGTGTQTAVPALLFGGEPGLRDGAALQWQDATVPLTVVGTAPDVDASTEPVVVVDSDALAAAGASATPDTVWAVGPGAADALTSRHGSASVVTYADQLHARRHAPLASALVRLAAISSVLLLVYALLGVVLTAAGEAPARGQALGRLRSLGLADADLRRVLSGELLASVTLPALAGLGLGLGGAYATFGSLSLERITGETVAPHVVVPWWAALAVGAVVLTALAVAAAEWRRLRRRPLAELLRS